MEVEMELTGMLQVYVEHESVALTRQQQSEPIDLDYCLEAFTKEEHLGEDEKYYCSKCREHQLASKKLQIWRLPPILVSIRCVTYFPKLNNVLRK
jgi:ubiquitin carboxyl-terminal hydrolase 6/32